METGKNEVFVCSRNRIFPKNPVFLKNFMPEKPVFQINGESVSDSQLCNFQLLFFHKYDIDPCSIISYSGK